MSVALGRRMDALVRWPYKLIRRRGFSVSVTHKGRTQRVPYELYDLEADPQENENLAHEKKELVGGLLSRLKRELYLAHGGSPDHRGDPALFGQVQGEYILHLRAWGGTRTRARARDRVRHRDRDRDRDRVRDGDRATPNPLSPEKLTLRVRSGLPLSLSRLAGRGARGRWIGLGGRVLEVSGRLWHGETLRVAVGIPSLRAGVSLDLTLGGKKVEAGEIGVGAFGLKLLDRLGEIPPSVLSRLEALQEPVFEKTAGISFQIWMTKRPQKGEAKDKAKEKPTEKDKGQGSPLGSSEKPVSEKPVSEKPVSEKPVSEKPVSEKITASLSRDLDADGRGEEVRITCTRCAAKPPQGGRVVLVKAAGKTIRPPFELHRLNPWKLTSGDVDGDGRFEVAVGVYKKSRYDPVWAKRVFFYKLGKERLLPKWLGSRLSRRFDDFVLADLDGDATHELVALERRPGGGHLLGVYRWHSFGFRWVGSSQKVRGAERLSALARGVEVVGRGAQRGPGGAAPSTATARTCWRWRAFQRPSEKGEGEGEGRERLRGSRGEGKMVPGRCAVLKRKWPEAPARR